MDSRLNLQKDIDILHFVGIGGIGMSAIAEILHNLGYQVQGSDLNANPNVQRLKKLGINVFTGHSKQNIAKATVIIKSSAIKNSNPEIIEATTTGKNVYLRADMLAFLMRLKKSIAVAGTHGKTTTTSLTYHILEAAGLLPTVINGGIINSCATNALLGEGSWLVAEADESDRSFLKLPADIAIITNIDAEHMESYSSYEDLILSFKKFIYNLPMSGCAILCSDNETLSQIIPDIKDRKIITYGLGKKSNITAKNINNSNGISQFDIQIDLLGTKALISKVQLPLPGKHNILNCLAAICVALELGVSHEKIKNAFTSFKGVKRRFTKTGEVGGVTIIDDYGHHPYEIKATLNAAKEIVLGSGKKGNVIAVMQPHRYSRVKYLFDDFCKCFIDANKVIISDIYEAGESPIDGISRDSLVAGIKSAGHQDVIALDEPSSLPQIIKSSAKTGDLVVCMGAGNITQWANDLPKQLK